MAKHAKSRTSGRYDLDDLDRRIVKALMDDARAPFQSIARELSVDEKTIRNRVARLRDADVLSFRPVTNGNILKGCISAIVAINIRTDIRNDVERLAEEVAELPMVSWVGTVMGQYDLIAEVIVDSWDALTHFELQELPAIKGVGATSSFLVLNNYGRRGVPFVDAILNPVE